MLHTELSADARTLADMLIACPIEDVITHDAMSSAIGRDVTLCRHVLATARRVALREVGAFFTAERSVGLRRVSAERATEIIGPNARKHIRKTAGKARRSLIAATETANDLPDDAMRRRAAEISALGLLEHISRDAPLRKATENTLKPLPVAVTARSFLAVISGKKEDAA